MSVGKGEHRFAKLFGLRVDLARLAAIWPELSALPPKLAGQLAIDAQYAAYVRRQEEDVAALRRDEAVGIPADFDFDAVPGLSA